MEANCLSKAQEFSLDVISTLPQTIIETILCLLPIEDAARTSILSRDWRYKWTTIPKLKFNMSIVYKSKTKEKMMDLWCKLFYAIHQVMLMRQGPIHEFTLNMPLLRPCFEIDQIIFHLSRNHTVKKLTLGLGYHYCYKLPVCTFSLHQLTDLHLNYIDLDHPPTFSGFGSLRNLCLIDVRISTKALLHLLSHCPSLTIFSLHTSDPIGDKDCTIIDLFECLPMIEQLTISGITVEPWLVLDSIPEELPTSLIHIKYFRFEQMCFTDDHGLTFLVVLLKCSPNLEKFKIDIEQGYCDHELSSAILKKYSDVWFEHLKEFEIEYFNNFIAEMEFVKFILARSSKLEKVWIYSAVETKEEELEMSKILLQAPRASPVEIIVESSWEYDNEDL